MTAERTARVGERIRAELMDLVLSGQLKDPGTRGATVHAVRVSGDLRHARVFVRLDEPAPSEARQRALMRGLERAKGFLRRAVAERLKLRHAPELAFFWDDTAEKASRIEAILDDLGED
ncbi:MAG: 30S ribosome-binding factor RbfA [Sandaracinaceae bacterium]|nr:30S ribosome-binding factor RbfA [Sandaracinaceae bacterium]